MSMKYSPTETKLLKLIPPDGTRITTGQLTSKLYRNRKDKPIHAQVYVSNSLRTLGVKVRANRESFKLKRTPKNGPNAVEFWFDK